MTVLRIVADRWEGVLNHEEIIESPSAKDFDRVFDRLDARVFTMITLQAETGRHMTIGGGGGRYIVYVADDDEHFWNLLQPEAMNGVVTLNAGGQEGDYSVTQVVNKQDAQQAGRMFLSTGQLDPALRWERQ